MTDRFSNFADLAEHYAREIATPDYARAFMEQTELAKLSIEHEPSAAEMPDPEVAQAAIEMMLATVFDLFRDTRMEDFASEVAWGVANSFHVVAKRLDDREDAMAAEADLILYPGVSGRVNASRGGLPPIVEGSIGLA